MEAERTLYDDMDEALLRAKQLVRHVELPKEDDTEEVALMKIIKVIQALCDRIDNPKIITI